MPSIVNYYYQHIQIGLKGEKGLKIEILKNYREDKALRDSMNELTRKTFKFSFDHWYQSGYWNDKYNPYSVFMDGKIVANVSVNQMNMMVNGEKKHFIQLGTVMTDPDYRGRGYIREIMKEIDHDYEGKCDGIYLFANDSVLDFYPKFGFHPEHEYQYSRSVKNTEPRTVVNVPMQEKSEWDKMKNIIDRSQAFYGFDMVDNSDLCMFYLSQSMKKNVYYAEQLKAYIVAEEENHELIIHDIFAERKVSIADVVKAFGPDIEHVTLEFVPDYKEDYDCNILQEKDCTLFVKGKGLEDFSKKHLIFTSISHA